MNSNQKYNIAENEQNSKVRIGGCGLVAVAAMMAAVASAGTRIIAHRGYWTLAGSAQNSIAALEATHHIGAYGSEFDVWITQDNQLVVNHDPEIGGVTIETAKWLSIRTSKTKS